MNTKILARKSPTILFLILCVSLIIGGNTANNFSGSQQNMESSIIISPISAADGLPGNLLNITNADGDEVSSVYRAIDTVTLNYDFTITPGDIYVASFTLENNDQFNLTMVEQPDSNWTVDFTPSIYNFSGVAEIMIIDVLGVDIVDNVPLGEVRELTILNNIPKIALELNSTAVKRGDSLNIDIIPSDVENPVDDLQWEVILQEASNDDVVETLVTTEMHDLSYVMDTAFTDDVGEYYLNATCWDLDGDQISKYYDLDVVNNEPEFMQIEFEIDEVTKTAGDLSTTGILRSTELLFLKVNVTDAELDDNPEDLSLAIEIDNPLTGENLVSLTGIDPSDLDSTYFDVNFSLPVNAPLGKVEMFVFVVETVDSVVYKSNNSYPLLVKNNAPIINEIYLNEESEEQINLESTDQLAFTFDVEDEEGSVSYVEVHLEILVDGDNTEYTFGAIYVGSSTEITIRALDLPAGNYNYYVVVYDEDGLSTTSDISSFNLEADPAVEPMVWLMLSVGLIIGAAITAAIFFSASRGSVKTVVSDSKPKKAGKSKSKSVSPKDKPSKLEKKESKPNPSKKKKKKVIRKL